MATILPVITKQGVVPILNVRGQLAIVRLNQGVFICTLCREAWGFGLSHPPCSLVYINRFIGKEVI